MWKLSITKKFVIQLIKLTRENQKFVMDNVSYLLKVSDVDQPFEIDIIDECDEPVEDKPFPITFKIDHATEHVYIISIEHHLLGNNGNP